MSNRLANQLRALLMRIEDELKTNKFQSSTQKAHISVLFTAGWVRNRINQSLRIFDLTSEQYNVLRIVRGQKSGKIRVKDINERMLERSSNTTRLIDRLLEKGLLLREKVQQGDGRERAITLTPEGRTLLEQVDKHWVTNNPHQSLLNDEEAAILVELLDKLRE
jgi:DNA-binding MarR family transcriptional regulator